MNKLTYTNNTYTHSARNKTLTTKALVEWVQPTHFITISLVQGRQIAGENGSQAFVRGDDVIYSRTHEGFIRSLSKRLTSRTAWKYHKPMLRSACVIEGGQNGERNHLHLIISKPAHVDEETFREMVLRSAWGDGWVMNGAHSVDIQRIDSAREAMSATFYSVKRGVDRVCLS